MALPDYGDLAGQNSMMPQRNQGNNNRNTNNTNNRNTNRPKRGKMLPVQPPPAVETPPAGIPGSGSSSGGIGGPYGNGPGSGGGHVLPHISSPVPEPTTTPTNDWTVPEVPLNPGPFTFGSGGLDNPFYDPSATYIPQGYRGNTVAFGNTAGSPDPASLGNVWAEDNPEAYYYGLINQKGYGGMDARSRAAQSMYADYYRGYQAAHLNNSELMWAQYANQQNPNNLVQLLSNDQLGINQQNTGPINWTLRG